MSDTRIVYGAGCMWWDSIDKVSSLKGYSGSTLPCCPICKGMLFEVPDMKTWEDGAKKYEEDGHPGYFKFLTWLRGKCFKTRKEADAAYAEAV